MEPITIAWMMSTIIGGLLGNRSDALLCSGANKLYKRIIDNVNEPTNHHIQKAIRKSYLQAVYLATDHLQKQHKWYSLTDSNYHNLKVVKDYLKTQIVRTANESSLVQSSYIDREYKEILFPKPNSTSNERLLELVKLFKDAVINELQSKDLWLDERLIFNLLNGWKEGEKGMDFYKLTCAFFVQELKDNIQLSTYIQTEYLDVIANDIVDLKITVDDLNKQIEIFYTEYKGILYKLEEISSSLNDIKIDITSVPAKTAELVLKGLELNIVNNRQLSLSNEYQKFIFDIKIIEEHIAQGQLLIQGVNEAILQVDTNTKILLEQNKKKLELELLKNHELRKVKEDELNEFINNVINLARYFKNSENKGSKRIHQAKLLFEEGKFEEVSIFLNEEEMEKEALNYKENIDGLTILATEYIIKAKTELITKKSDYFLKVNELYNKALNLIENYETTTYYAEFLLKNQNISKAEILYKKSLYFCGNYESQANALNCLGLIQLEKNEFSLAEICFQHGLEIYCKLANDNSNGSDENKSMVYNNLGLLYKKSKDFKSSEKSYLESLKILYEMKNINDTNIISKLINVLCNLSMVQLDLKDLKSAETTFEEIQIMNNKLAGIDNKLYLDKKISILNLSSTIHYDKGEFTEASSNLNEAIMICRKFIEKEPVYYLMLLSKLYDNLGVILKKLELPNEAESKFNKANELRNQIIKINPNWKSASILFEGLE